VAAAAAAGRRHEVVTPALTGPGERSHLASPRIDLVGTNVLDVVGVLEYEDLLQPKS
jgi:hypothetical protein